MKKHYVADVVAGATLGILGSYLFTEPYQGLTITPVASRQEFGIQLSTRW